MSEICIANRGGIVITGALIMVLLTSVRTTKPVISVAGWEVGSGRTYFCISDEVFRERGGEVQTVLKTTFRGFP